jgi:hypothetical protein
MLSDVNLLAAESGKGDIGDLVRSGHFDVNMCLFWGVLDCFVDALKRSWSLP